MKASLITLVVGALILGAAGFTVYHATAPHAETPKAGSVGPVDNTNFHCWAGVCEYFGSSQFRVASGTLAAIQSPPATSTLGSVLARFDTGSSTALNVFIGTGPTPFATTSALGSTNAVAGGKQAFVQGSTSPAAGSNTVLAPNTWVILQTNLGISSGDTTGTGFTPSGQFLVKFTVPQS